MELRTLADTAVGLAVFVVIVYRQVRPRRLTGVQWKLLAVLAAFGVYQTYAYLHGAGRVEVGAVVATLTGFVLAAALAWPRARSMRIWQRNDGTWMTRGSLATVAIWVVTLAAHLGVSWLVPQLFGEPGRLMGGLEQATIMFYLVITLGVRSWVSARRRDTEQVLAAARV